MKKIDKNSLNLRDINIKALKELFPQAIKENKIDFEKLKLALGEDVEDSIEKYQFSWNGKNSSIKLAQKPSIATLRPSKKDSVDWNATENLYIEGDNLEVLKQLQKTYFGKIKMIYIDPPYNTGGDFVYKDDFRDSLKNYKEQTNQSKSSNAEIGGRYHTDWLNMMYPRLMLAKNLLSNNGVIFVSIDDSEYSNIVKVLIEIFGETNYIGSMVRKRRNSQANLSKNISTIHEYIVAFSKKDDDILNKVPGKINKNAYKNKDNDPRGPYVTMPCTNKGGAVYQVQTPTGVIITEEWRFKKETYEKLLNDNRIVFPREGKGKPRYKLFLKDKIEEGVIPNTWLDQLPPNQEATRELKTLFGDMVLFNNPKPVGLIEYLLEMGSNKDSTILDFFSGSATTAHAVMKLNAEDGGNRKFIMVQLPEKTDEKSEAFKAGYKNICEIGKERIRRAGQQIKQELIDKKNKAGMLDENIVYPESLDIGFKVFKLDDTNIKAWDSSAEVTKDSLLDQVEVIKENRSKEDVLYEILLKYGVFNHTVKEITINDKTMYDIADGYMIVNLNDKIEDTDVKEITKRSPHVVIFLESGFINDNDKINAEATLKHNGVEDVKCI